MMMLGLQPVSHHSALSQLEKKVEGGNLRSMATSALVQCAFSSGLRDKASVERTDWIAACEPSKDAVVHVNIG